LTPRGGNLAVYCANTPGSPTRLAVPAAAQATCAGIAQFLQNTYSDPITVNIDVEFEQGAMGASSFAVSSLVPYTTYLAKLTADEKDAIDGFAVASLNNAGNGPIPGDGNIYITPANARAVGINNPANILARTIRPCLMA
jgi:hypothetical protein